MTPNRNADPKVSRRSRAGKDQKNAISISADQVLDDLSALLWTLGIAVKFRISNLNTNKRGSSQSRGVQPFVYVIGEVLSRWHQEPVYLDDLGNPKPLPFAGKRPSFSSLVSKSASGLTPRAMLVELQKAKAVGVTYDGKICALRRSLNAFGDREFAINHTFLALRGFIQTLQHNLDSVPSNADQLFHRVAWNGAFNRKDTARLKNWVAEHGESFLESIDDWMKRHSVSIDHKGRKRKSAVNAAIGVYLAVDP